MGLQKEEVRTHKSGDLYYFFLGFYGMCLNEHRLTTDTAINSIYTFHLRCQKSNSKPIPAERMKTKKTQLVLMTNDPLQAILRNIINS